MDILNFSSALIGMCISVAVILILRGAWLWWRDSGPNYLEFEQNRITRWHDEHLQTVPDGGRMVLKVEEMRAPRERKLGNNIFDPKPKPKPENVWVDSDELRSSLEGYINRCKRRHEYD